MHAQHRRLARVGRSRSQSPEGSASRREGHKRRHSREPMLPVTKPTAQSKSPTKKSKARTSRASRVGTSSITRHPSLERHEKKARGPLPAAPSAGAGAQAKPESEKLHEKLETLERKIIAANGTMHSAAYRKGTMHVLLKEDLHLIKDFVRTAKESLLRLKQAPENQDLIKCKTILEGMQVYCWLKHKTLGIPFDLMKRLLKLKTSLYLWKRYEQSVNA